MPSRKEMVNSTSKKLLEAFERLKEGVPLRVVGPYKISPSKIEDEAGVARSTLYGKPYADILREVQNYKNVKSASEKGLDSEVELLKARIKTLRAEVENEKEKRRQVAESLKVLESEFLNSVSEHMEVVKMLLDVLPHEKRQKISHTLGKISYTSSSSNVVLLKSKRNRMDD